MNIVAGITQRTNKMEDFEQRKTGNEFYSVRILVITLGVKFSKGVLLDNISFEVTFGY